MNFQFVPFLTVKLNVSIHANMGLILSEKNKENLRVSYWM